VNFTRGTGTPILFGLFQTEKVKNLLSPTLSTKAICEENRFRTPLGELTTLSQTPAESDEEILAAHSPDAPLA